MSKQNPTTRRALTSCLVVLGLSAILAGCSLNQSTADATPHMPAPVTERGMTLDWGEDVKTQALRMIQSSHRYAYLDIYELSDSDVMAALRDAKHRGVDVRVVLDATESHSQSVGFPTLQRDGVPVESIHISHGISHVKLLVCDGQALIGGMNFGDHSWANNDASVFFQHANPSFVSMFQWDWNRAQGQPETAPSYELPLLDDRTNETNIIQAIQSATQTIAMEAFDLSDYGVVDALDEAVKRGVNVQILLDPGQSWSRKAAYRLTGDGASIRYYSPYQGELMHAKILDVDGGATFIIGSANFSHQAFTYNHEADVLLKNVPLFDKALQDNVTTQFNRGTDTPTQHDWGGTGQPKDNALG